MVEGMKLILSPKDKEEAIRMLRATDVYLVLHEFLEELRKVWKYSDVAPDVAAAEKWRDELLSIMRDRGISFDDLR